MLYNRLARQLFAVGLCLLVVLAADITFAKKKKRGGNSKGRSQAIAALRQGIAARKAIAATAAQQLSAAVAKGTISQAALDRLTSDANAAVEAIRAAKANSKNEADNVNDIEGDILSRLPNDSPYRKAEDAYLEALDQFERARRRVLESDEYKRAYAIAKGGPDVNERLTALRKESLDGNDDVVRTRRTMLAAKERLAVELAELLNDDGEWKNAVEVSKEARRDESKARLEIRKIMLHKLGATSSRNEALDAAVDAQATLMKARSDIAKLEAALKRMSGGRRSKSSSGSPRSKR